MINLTEVESLCKKKNVVLEVNKDRTIFTISQGKKKAVVRTNVSGTTQEIKDIIFAIF